MRSSLPVPALVSVALVCLLVSAVSRAEDEERKNLANRCRAEVEKLCPGSRPGSVERRACVRDKADQLPEECRTAMRRGGGPASGPAGAEALLAACGEDIEAHCENIRRGGGRLVRCLQAVDPAKLSSTCKAQLDTMGTRGRSKAPEALPKAPAAVPKAPEAPPEAAPAGD